MRYAYTHDAHLYLIGNNQLSQITKVVVSSPRYKLAFIRDTESRWVKNRLPGLWRRAGRKTSVYRSKLFTQQTRGKLKTSIFLSNTGNCPILVNILNEERKVSMKSLVEGPRISYKYGQLLMIVLAVMNPERSLSGWFPYEWRETSLFWCEWNLPGRLNPFRAARRGEGCRSKQNPLRARRLT